jgi:hypothetical protein
MPHDPGADLHQPVAQGRERPPLNLLGQRRILFLLHNKRAVPVPRMVWPRMVVSLQRRPRGPAIRSAFRSRAIARGDLPVVNSRKIRRTISASASLIRRPLRLRLDFGDGG